MCAIDGFHPSCRKFETFEYTEQKLHEERRMEKHKLQEQRILFTALRTETEESDEKDVVIFVTFLA